MNRETKRMMQRQGQMEADGSPSARRQAPAQAGKRPAKQRTTVVQFFREVRDELRQVAWPSRSEMINYTAVVLTTLVLMVSLVFALNYVFGRAVFFMFQK
ncbi:MAG: preprotein translocase subunit SecE [Acidimicrobiales bacterium]